MLIDFILKLNSVYFFNIKYILSQRELIFLIILREIFII
jgi:hypothetical protein